MDDLHHFVSVEFTHFKALSKFSLRLRRFNILVGPNNAGKSTILAAFRILAIGLRRAATRKTEVVKGPQGDVQGYRIDLSVLSDSEENIFYNYDDSKPATVRFKLSNGGELLLFFPTSGGCNLIAAGKANSPAAFNRAYNCPIGFVPILGPVEHNEPLFDKEAARKALFNHRASRNFRNIWHHYPEKFDEFRQILNRTWPGMDIEKPKPDFSHARALLHMFCPEERIPREIFWAGFGFQVWCQMLTHAMQAKDKSLFLVDEPDIYLHSELQRQLLTILRHLGPDILIATHSTEIISEAEADDIVLVSKSKSTARRISNPSELGAVFSLLGSNLNPILTQLARTRRVVFVEGKDFQIISRFAVKLGVAEVSTRSGFAVVPVHGFNPQRIRNLKEGMETTLGSTIQSAAILDRDYRGDAERNAIQAECSGFCDIIRIHSAKEIENFLLVPSAIDRAAQRRLVDHAKRSGKSQQFDFDSSSVLSAFAEDRRDYVTAQYLDKRRKFEKSSNPSAQDAVFNESCLQELRRAWSQSSLTVLPGKEAVSEVNRRLQERHGISITPTAIIDAMHAGEVMPEMKALVNDLAGFAARAVD